MRGVKASKWLCCFLVIILTVGISDSVQARHERRTKHKKHKKTDELLSEENEIKFGHYVDAQITNDFLVLGNKKLTAQIADIGHQIVPKSGRPHLEFTFKILNDSMINAFAGPGGYIYITTGLLDHLKSRDELAAVLAHEIGHVSARHQVKAFAGQQKVKGAFFLIGLAAVIYADEHGSSNTDLGRMVGYMVTIAVYQGYSRADEFEADQLGAIYAHRAGFDPEGMIDLFKTFIKLREEEGAESQWTIFSSHPPTPDRIERIKSLIPKLEKEGDLSDENQNK